MLTLTVILSIVMLLNGMVWLAISGLILYNILEYTLDKHNLRKDFSPFMRKYVRWI